MKYKLILLTLILFAIDLSYSTDINYIEKITPKGTYLNLANNLYVSSSNVGIGTDSPTAKLQIGGMGAADATVLAIEGYDLYKRNILFTESGASSAYGGIIRYDSGADILQLVTLENNVEKQGISIKRSTGNVGIGTTSPGAKLDVEGNLILQYGTAINEFSTDTALSGNSDSAVPTEKAVKTYVDAHAGSGLTGTGTANYLTKWTGTTSLGTSVIYESGGNIGIGTTSPGAKLDVVGDVKGGGKFYIDGAGWTEGNLAMGVLPTYGFHLKDGNDYGGMYLRKEGNDANDLTIWWGDYDNLRFTEFVWNGSVSVPNTRMFIKQGGNVGIGTTSPSYKLHVNGNFYANTVNTGIGNTEVYLMNQNVRTTDAVTFATVNTGQGANELYAMNQNVRTTDAVTFATVNTGQGANELYAMNQNVRTTDAVTFATIDTGSGAKELGDAPITDGDTNSIPTNDQVYDFVTAYVGSGGSGDIYVNEAGDTMTGNLDMNGNKIINVNKLHATSMGIADTTTNAEANIPAGNSLYVQNDIKIGGNLKGYGADLAENFYFKGDLEPGDVVIITHYQGVEKSTKPYDTRVAGIVSTNPAQIMAIGREGVPVALAGSTPVKVTNESGEIHFGDLLTSSSKPGYAMKCSDKCEGSILGKALEEFNQSEGMISALVMLS